MSTSEMAPIYSNLTNDDDLADLVQDFVKSLQQRAASLDAAAQSESLTDIIRLAHQLRGASGSYGFDSIGLAAGELEMTGRASQSIEQVRNELDNLISMCRRARVAAPTA